MFQSLRLRLFLTFITVIILAVAVVALFANQGTTSGFNAYVDRSYVRDQQVIAAMLEQRLQHEGVAGAQLFAEAVGQAYGRPVALVNDKGIIIVASSPEWIGMKISDNMPAPPPSSPPGHGQNRGGSFMYQVGPGQRVQMGRYLVSPGGSSFTIETYTEPSVVSLLPEENEQQFLGSVNRSFLLAAAAAIFLAGVLSVAFSRRILGPVEALTAAARKMEKGDLSQRVEASSEDEIGKLSHAFNAMADGLARLEHLRQNMVTDIAHELRTPLTNIRGYLEAVQDGVLEPDPATINTLHEETLLLHHLVEDLQELSLAEAGRLRLDKQPLRVSELIIPAITGMLPLAQEKGVSLIKELPADTAVALADPDRAGQVLRNLLNNALTHTPAGGSILVTAVLQDTDVLISVADTGPGIDPEHLPYIFDRFYRADPSRNRATGGSGLGLAIAKSLIEMQDGRLWAESTPGDGATFTFTLPLVQ